jgi:hypothetical protein
MMAVVHCLYSNRFASEICERPRKVANIIFGVYKQSPRSLSGIWLLFFSVLQDMVGKILNGRNNSEIEKLKLSRVIKKKDQE